MAFVRRSQPVWVLLGNAKPYGVLINLDVLQRGAKQPLGVLELLSTAADCSHQKQPTGPTCFPQLADQLRLLPPLARASLAAQSRGFHSSRLLSGPFQLTRPCLSAEKLPKHTSGPAAKPSASLPKAEDCDTAIREIEDLHWRLNQLERPSSLRGIGSQVKDVIVAIGNGLVAVVRFTATVPSRIERFRSMSKEEWQAKKSAMWTGFKHEAHHYWVGFKLLAYEVRVASTYALKAARGEELTRRERRQLTRTTADLFRLVPLVIIVVVPFLEFTLPLLLRLFPNMLPSTFEDKLKKEEEMKRRLSVKLELAKFLQDTVSEMAKDLQRTGKGKQAVTANELYEFLQKIRAGAAVENHEIIRFAQLFNDALTLDNLERVQLVSIAQFVGLSPFGTDQFLRNRLRARLQQIKHDDYEIEREGLENLTEDELRQACRARGMRAPFGEGAVPFMRRQLQDWLDLSLHRGLPSSLLLLSRAFTITASVKDVAAKKDLAYEKLKETLSVIPEEVVERVEFEALGGAKGGAKALAKKLEFLKREEELIKEEAKAAKAAAKDTAAAAKAATAKAATAKAAAAKAAPEAQPFTSAAAVGATGDMAAFAAEARAASAAAAAAEAAAFAPNGTVLSPGMAEAAQAAAAAAMGAALKPELDAALTVEALSDEEKAAKVAAAREARVSAILESLLSLAASSAVARERQLFMELVRNEMARLNRSIVEKTVGSSMAFSSAGLQVAGGAANGGAAANGSGPTRARTTESSTASGGEPNASKRLGDRVAKMLHSIELELDNVENKIGDRLQLLDADRDGVVSKQELQAAVMVLRQQLDPSDLDLLFEKLGLDPYDTASSSPIKLDELAAIVEQRRAAAAAERNSDEATKTKPSPAAGGSPKREGSKEGGKKSEGSKKTEAGANAEVVKIHTM